MGKWILRAVLWCLIASPANACGHGVKAMNPDLTVMLDQQLPQATITEADLEKIKALRDEIEKLAVAGNIQKARDLEEQAMAILGFKKTWLRCGPNLFTWVKLKPGPGS